MKTVRVTIPKALAFWRCPECRCINKLPVAAAQIGEGTCTGCKTSFWFEY